MVSTTFHFSGSSVFALYTKQKTHRLSSSLSSRITRGEQREREGFRRVYANPSTSIGGYRFRRLPLAYFHRPPPPLPHPCPDISAAKVKERGALPRTKSLQSLEATNCRRLPSPASTFHPSPFDFPLFPDRPFLLSLVSSISISLLRRLYFRERTRGLHGDELREREREKEREGEEDGLDRGASKGRKGDTRTCRRGRRREKLGIRRGGDRGEKGENGRRRGRERGW